MMREHIQSPVHPSIFNGRKSSRFFTRQHDEARSNALIATREASSTGGDQGSAMDSLRV
jgi:hypothetical protein